MTILEAHKNCTSYLGGTERDDMANRCIAVVIGQLGISTYESLKKISLALQKLEDSTVFACTLWL